MGARDELTELLARSCRHDGFNDTPVPGVDAIRYSQTDGLANRRWRASVCLVTQGGKELRLGNQVYRNDHDAHTITTPIELPVTSRIFSATGARPFLCLRVAFDPAALAEVAGAFGAAEPEDEGPIRAVFVQKTSDALLDAGVRLARLFSVPDDARVLGPLVVKEIFYHLLKGPDGPAIRQFVRSGSKRHRMAEALHRLRSGYQDNVDIDALARAVNMSRSAFFRDFKEVTALSPLQYQKRLRLLEARRLMTEAGETAEGSAYRVGYRSSSQFSREYSRMFGSPPRRDAVGGRGDE